MRKWYESNLRLWLKVELLEVDEVYRILVVAETVSEGTLRLYTLEANLLNFKILFENRCERLRILC